jgi:excisionase family DNA binding protein
MGMKQASDEPLLLTVDQVAELIQCSTPHVYRMEKRGEIPRAVRLGASVRWPRRVIEDWIAAGCPKNAAWFGYLQRNASSGTMAGMATKPFSEQLRQAILESGKSRYRIAKETGVTEAQLSRFIRGHSDLALLTLDKIIPCIGARLTTDSKSTRKRVVKKRKAR